VLTYMRCEKTGSGWFRPSNNIFEYIHQCLLAVLKGRENEPHHPREVHDNEGFEEDEGIAESGM